MTSPSTNREDYLQAALNHMAPWFEEVDQTLPTVRVSIGWPKGARGGHVVGQCWDAASADDNMAQIFISPDRGQDAIVDILGTLLHEAVHATVGTKCGHKGDFIRVSRALGFKAAWTSSANRGEELTERLTGLSERLGPFPHAALNLVEKETTQKTYMLKITCDDCGYQVRTTKKMLDRAVPQCPSPDCDGYQQDMTQEEK